MFVLTNSADPDEMQHLIRVYTVNVTFFFFGGGGGGGDSLNVYFGKQ